MKSRLLLIVVALTAGCVTIKPSRWTFGATYDLDERRVKSINGTLGWDLK